MKTRWGTCNIQAQRIWLNLELIKKPELCLEYVVVHEMVHLLERKHNDRFGIDGSGHATMAAASGRVESLPIESCGLGVLKSTWQITPDLNSFWEGVYVYQTP